MLDLTKLKAFAYDKINVAHMMVSVFDKIGNIVLPAFSPFLKMFSKGFFLGSHKSGLCGKKLTLSQTSPSFYVSAVQVF